MGNQADLQALPDDILRDIIGRALDDQPAGTGAELRLVSKDFSRLVLSYLSSLPLRFALDHRVGGTGKYPPSRILSSRHPLGPLLHIQIPEPQANPMHALHRLRIWSGFGTRHVALVGHGFEAGVCFRSIVPYLVHDTEFESLWLNVHDISPGMIEEWLQVSRMIRRPMSDWAKVRGISMGDQQECGLMRHSVLSQEWAGDQEDTLWAALASFPSLEHLGFPCSDFGWGLPGTPLAALSNLTLLGPITVRPAENYLLLEDSLTPQAFPRLRKLAIRIVMEEDSQTVYSGAFAAFASLTTLNHLDLDFAPSSAIPTDLSGLDLRGLSALTTCNLNWSDSSGSQVLGPSRACQTPGGLPLLPPSIRTASFRVPMLHTSILQCFEGCTDLEALSLSLGLSQAPYTLEHYDPPSVNLSCLPDLPKLSYFSVLCSFRLNQHSALPFTGVINLIHPTAGEPSPDQPAVPRFPNLRFVTLCGAEEALVPAIQDPFVRPSLVVGYEGLGFEARQCREVCTSAVLFYRPAAGLEDRRHLEAWVQRELAEGLRGQDQQALPALHTWHFLKTFRAIARPEAGAAAEDSESESEGEEPEEPKMEWWELEGWAATLSRNFRRFE